MRFKTSELIKNVENKIEATKLLIEKQNKAETAKVAEHRAKYLKDHSDAWIAFANKIREKTRKERPILDSDIPHELNRSRFRGELDTFRPYEPRIKEVDVSGLESLLAALKSITDEEVSPTGLKNLGFKDLSRLF